MDGGLAQSLWGSRCDSQTLWKKKSFGEFGKDEERICKGFVGSQSLRNERGKASIYRIEARVVANWSFGIW